MTHKTFTLSLPNNDTFATTKHTVMSNLAHKYPYLTWDSKVDYPFNMTSGIEYASPGDLLTFGLNKQYDVSWAPANTYFANTANYDLLTEYEKALKAIDLFAKKNTTKFNKFITTFDTPIVITEDFIQIGYDVIPRNNYGYTLKTLEPSVKKIVIDFTIKINNYNF